MLSDVLYMLKLRLVVTLLLIIGNGRAQAPRRGGIGLIVLDYLRGTVTQPNRSVSLLQGRKDGVQLVLLVTSLTDKVNTILMKVFVKTRESRIHWVVTGNETDDVRCDALAGTVTGNRLKPLERLRGCELPECRSSKAVVGTWLDTGEPVVMVRTLDTRLRGRLN